MTHKLEILRKALVCVVLAGFAVVAGELAYFGVPILDHLASAATTLSSTADRIDKLVWDDPKGLRGTTQLANATLIQIEEAAAEWQRSSKAQSGYVTSIAANTKELTGAAKTAVQDLDSAAIKLSATIDNVNTNTVPAATGAIISLQHATEEFSKDAKPVLAASVDSLHGLSTVAESTNRILVDPDITRGIKNLADGSGHLDSTAAALDKTAWLIERRFEPQHLPFWKQLLDCCLIPGIFHLIPQVIAK